MNNLILIIIFSINFIKHCDSSNENILFRYNEGTEIDDPCILEKSQDQGVCKLIQNCPVIFALAKRRIKDYTVCGYEGRQQIVCCPYPDIANRPYIDTRIVEHDLIEDYDCVVSKTNKKGVMKFLKHCDSVQMEVLSGAPIPAICNYEICSDMVCCPVENLRRLKQKCKNYDDPETEIEQKLKLGLPCTIPGTNTEGRLQNSCKKLQYNTNLKPICDYPVCKGWYCCPLDSENDFNICDTKDYPNFPNVELIGGPCVDSATGKKGKCRPWDQCPAFLTQILDTCQGLCCTMFFCCPDIEEHQLTFSEQKCASYRRAVYTHHIDVKLISNDLSKCDTHGNDHQSIEAQPRQFSHMASLGYITKINQIDWGCSGSLISENFVLTSAQCLFSEEHGEVKIVRLGVLNLKISNNTIDCPEDYFVSHQYQHPNYTKYSIYNDIALIKLDRNVKFNPYIRPICLPQSNEIPDILITMGWQSIGPEALDSNVLVKIFTDLYTNEECTKTDILKYDQRLTANGIDIKTQFCAGSKNQAIFTCTSQPGGSIFTLHMEYDKMATIVGITTYGKMCGFVFNPAIYTQVYPFVEWIESIIWK